MKRILFLTLLFALSIQLPTFAQITPTPQKPFIEVSGESEREITPDQIFITITIKERHEGKKKITIIEQEDELKKGIVKLGVPLKNLVVADLTASYKRIKWSNKDVLAQSQYILEAKDAVTVGKVFELLDEIDIKHAYISDVSHTQIDQFKREVNIEAIKDAHNKASYLLSAIGSKVGAPIEVREVSLAMQNRNQFVGESAYQVGFDTNADLAYNSYSNSTGKLKIGFRKIKITSNVYTKFGIEQ